MNFVKMHGAGNDYIYIDGFCENIENPERLAVDLSKYHYGIGADGIVIIRPDEKADCFMDIYNADGSRAKMCGNAVRCVAKFLYDRGRLSGTSAEINTLSGIKTVVIEEKNGKAVSATVNMGKPILNGKSIPTRFGDSVVKNKNIFVYDKYFDVTCVSMGNPHCVTFCEDPDLIDLSVYGERFENHEYFPDRINAEFVSVIGQNRLKVRVHERGSGETLACGTGACASAVAAVLLGKCDRESEISVQMKGGELFVCWGTDGDVYLNGEAVEVFTGKV
ncbi:MAG: diaminopimelate epimerase [Oscillospiraceae bacterium]|nr:diaminopimelate epimerase [Oscillospiraceae bacterium]